MSVLLSLLNSCHSKKRQAAISRLSFSYYQNLSLCFFNGLLLAEIKHVLTISLHTVVIFF